MLKNCIDKHFFWIKINIKKLCKLPKAIDPIEAATSDEIVRRKRLSEHLEQVRRQFHLCRSSKVDQNQCEKFYREMVTVSAALNQEIDTLGEFGRSVQSPSEPMHQKIPNNPRMPVWPANPLQPLREMKQEDKMLQKVSEIASFTRFHEDMENANVWSENVQNTQQEYPKLHSQSSTKTAKFRDNEKITPLKNSNFGKCSKDYYKHFQSIREFVKVVKFGL